MASTARDYLIQSIRQKAYEEHGYSHDDFEPIEEKIYVPTQREKWDEVREAMQWIQDEHGFDLTEEFQFLEELENPDKLEGVEEPEIDEKASTREKLLIQRQVRNSDKSEILAYTDETIGINHLFNLHESLYRETGKKAFIISKQREWDGRVAVELSETKKKFELMAVYENKDENRKFKHFGQANPNKGWNKVDDFTQSFYQYKFVADDQEYLALSTEKLDTVRTKLYGTHVSINDYKTVGENRKLPVNQDLIFVHSTEPAIEPLNTEELEDLQDVVDHDWFAEHLFGAYRHPDWFEELNIAMFSIGEDFDGYPPHFLWMAPPDTGKSTWLESLLIAFDEPQKEPFEGGGSTIKGLTPSFKENPPKEGLLLRAQRIAAVDEKLNLLKNTIESNNSATQDAFRPMTSLLEHKPRKFESGNGSISGKMEAQMIAATNDAYGISNLLEAQEKLDIPYLSRFIQYEQLDSHVEYVDQQQNQVDVEYREGLPDRDDQFISLMDTLRDIIRVDVDSERVGEMHNRLKEKVPAGFQQTFRARHKHHIKCIVAGLAKMRYFTENREQFEVLDRDYERAEELWEILISSWGEVDHEKLSINARLEAIPHKQRQVYQVVNDEPGILGSELVQRVDIDDLSWTLTNLRKQKLAAVVEDDSGGKHYYPYWTDEAEKAFNDEPVNI